MEKIKIVIDSHIFISAFFGNKKSKLILKEIINGEFLLVMYQEQLKEIKDVLYSPKFSRCITLEEVDELILLLSMKVIQQTDYEIVPNCRVPKRNMLLEEAINGNAQYIITCDEDLLDSDSYKCTKIFTIVDFITEIYEL